MSAIIRLKRKQFGLFNVGANWNMMKSAMSHASKGGALANKYNAMAWKSGAKAVGGAIAKTGAIAGGTALAGGAVLGATGFGACNALSGGMGSSDGLDNW